MKIHVTYAAGFLLGFGLYSCAWAQSAVVGKWADSLAECKSNYRIITDKTSTTVLPKAAGVPPEACRILSVKGTDKITMRMRCNDSSGAGDGPSSYAVTEVLTLKAPNELSYTSSAGGPGQVFRKKRCP